MPELSTESEERVLKLVEEIGFFEVLRHLASYSRNRRDIARLKGLHFVEKGWKNITNDLIMIPVCVGNVSQK